MFLSDEDGNAQLCRWYHGILRAFPSVWRSIAGTEGYLPSLAYKSAVESPTATIVRSPVVGTLLLNWEPGPDALSLTGRLTIGDDHSLLDLGGKTFELPTSDHADSGVRSVLWPEHLHCEAGIKDPVNGEHTIYFRPRSFDIRKILDSVIENGTEELDQTGILEAFLSIPRLEDKIAIAWLAVSKLEADP